MSPGVQSTDSRFKGRNGGCHKIRRSSEFLFHASIILIFSNVCFKNAFLHPKLLTNEFQISTVKNFKDNNVK